MGKLRKSFVLVVNYDGLVRKTTIGWN